MPPCLGRSGSVRATSMPMLAGLRGGGPHLLTGDDPLVAVLHRLGLQTGEVGARAWLLNSWHQPCSPSRMRGTKHARRGRASRGTSSVGAASIIPSPDGGPRRRGHHRPCELVRLGAGPSATVWRRQHRMGESGTGETCPPSSRTVSCGSQLASSHASTPSISGSTAAGTGSVIGGAPGREGHCGFAQSRTKSSLRRSIVRSTNWPMASRPESSSVAASTLGPSVSSHEEAPRRVRDRAVRGRGCGGSPRRANGPGSHDGAELDASEKQSGQQRRGG